MTETKRGPGRPATGRNPTLCVVVPRDLLARIDQRAANKFEKRSNVAVELLKRGLARVDYKSQA